MCGSSRSARPAGYRAVRDDDAEYLEAAHAGASRLGHREHARLAWLVIREEGPEAEQYVYAGGLVELLYVTEDTGVGGGRRDIFERLDRLRRARARGASCGRWAGRPTGSRCKAPVRHASRTTAALTAALAERGRDQGRDLVEHRRAGVARSVLQGIPVYFVQDIETSYYPDDERCASTSSPPTVRSSAT